MHFRFLFHWSPLNRNSLYGVVKDKFRRPKYFRFVLKPSLTLAVPGFSFFHWRRALRGARRFGGCVCGACVLSSASERVLFVKQPNREGCFLVFPRFSLSCTTALAPFRLEQGWTSKASTDGLFRVGAPLAFCFCVARVPPGFLRGPPLVFLVAALLSYGWFGT